jgi:hypothetical protein
MKLVLVENWTSGTSTNNVAAKPAMALKAGRY